jgi:cell division protein ZapA (FtsZ GTPase activity inhibitor)
MIQKNDGRQKKPTMVTIFGREYRIRSDEDEQTTRRVARFVDEKIQEVARRTQVRDPLGITVLAALNIAGEHLPMRENREAAAGMTVERLRRLIQLVDGTLAQTAPVRSSSRARD